MHEYKNIRIIGTSHIAKQSILEIERQYNEYSPDMICVELDKNRLHALLSGAKPDYSISGIRKYGLTGYLFAVIGGIIQKKLGNVVGIQPGSDMLTAVHLARNNKKTLMLIDQDIQITLKRFSKLFTFKEKMRLLWDILRSPFAKKVRIELNKVPKEEIIHMLITQFKGRYPGIYKALIEERNIYMAHNIYHIMNNNEDKKILIIIGAGHEKEMLELIQREHNKRDKIK